MSVPRDPYPVRKPMNHTPPFCVAASDAFYFVTLCAAERGGTPFTGRAADIIDAARHYQRAGKWFLSLFLVMPDHIHMLVHVPVGGDGRAVCPTPPHAGRALCPKAPQSRNNDTTLSNDCGGLGQTALPKTKYRSSLEHVIGEWKRYLSRKCAIAFQRDFFDTRIRDDQHYAEKWRYVCANPVARGLAAVPRDWPHVIAFDRETGAERPHR